jgi:hypothetical protein
MRYEETCLVDASQNQPLNTYVMILSGTSQSQKQLTRNPLDVSMKFTALLL